MHCQIFFFGIDKCMGRDTIGMDKSTVNKMQASIHKLYTIRNVIRSLDTSIMKKVFHEMKQFVLLDCVISERGWRWFETTNKR